ncbi:Tetratricopeptide repeat protein [Candidatus Koribacter versatilis Ellin345]|uniref:Tetratricopeptide repeat protein n=1 Tax=Koribacter versatilis (strain Ellin345) TaxID=204669 RepID=Q1IQ86_KORVE|nr:tetratricopeptide repeat protein [Candidatus Koribacter versatilis]ABF40964.1 Tetratricopeptide repeat protein [Candidatus Koribacter versatilis Ellin345]
MRHLFTFGLILAATATASLAQITGDDAASRCFRNSYDGPIACSEALSGNPAPAQKAQLLLAKGMLLTQAGEHTTATAIYRQALTLLPKSAEAHVIYAWGLDRSGETATADLEYKQAVQFGLMRGHEIVLGDTGKAMVAGIGHEGNFYFTAGQGLERAGQKNAAKAFYLKAAVDFAQRPDPLVVQAYDNAVRVDTSDPTTHWEIAHFWQQWDGSHGAEVVRHLKECARLAPNNAEYRYALGQAYAAIGDTANAAIEYREAVRLNPVNGKASHDLQLAAVSTGETGAIAAATLDSPEALAQLKTCVNQNGVRGEFACRSALKVGLSPHNSAIAHTFLAAELPTAEAIAEYREAIKSDPNYALSYYLLAQKFEGKEFQSAEDPVLLLDSAAKLRPDWIATREQLAAVLWARNRHAEAINAQREAVALDTADEKLAAHLKKYETDFAAEAEKVQVAQTGVKSAPSDPAAHRAYGLALASAGKMDDARSEFRTAFQLNPKNGWKTATAIMYGGFADVACEIYSTTKPEDAPDYPQSSLEQDLAACGKMFPEQTKYLASLAQLQYSRGDGAAVRQTYEMIVTMDPKYFDKHPEDRELYDHASSQKGAQ